MMFIGFLAGYCAALLILIAIDKWKEKKSRSLSSFTKFKALSDIEAYEEYIEAWSRAIDKAYEKHMKVLNGEEVKSEEKCFE